MPAWSPADLAPGLWLAILAGGLTAVIHRAYDRVGPVAMAAFTAIILIAFGPVLFAGKLLLPLDNLRGHVPFQEITPTEPHGNLLQGDLIQLVAPAGAEVRRALAAGRWPLWTARMGAGMPLLADPQAEALAPLTLAGRALPVAEAAGVTAALRVYTALLFTFVLLRRQGLAVGPALFGAASWGLGGFLMLWLGWPLANVAALLPAVLYGIARCAECGGRRDALLLAAATAALLVAGHPETILYSLLLAAAFLAVGLGRGGAAARRRPAVVAGALALGAFAVAPALLPAAAYLPQSLRAARLAEEVPPPAVAAAGERAIKRLLPIAAPNAFGNDRYVHYWGGENINEDASGFVGTTALLLAVLGAGGALARRRWRPAEGLMLGVAASCLLVVALPPPVVRLLAAIPAGATSGYHHRLLSLLGFALAYLAACELDRRGRDGGVPLTSRRGALTAAGILAAATALTALLAWAYLTRGFPREPTLLQPLRLGWLHWQLRFLALATLLLLAGRIRLRAPWDAAKATLERLRRATPYVLAAAAAAELLLAHLPAHPPMPRRLDFPAPPPLAYLEEHAGADRISALGKALPPNLGALYGIADARVYSPMAPAAYLRALEPVTAGWSGEVPQLGHPENPLYDLLGVRYVLAPPGLEPPPPLRPVLRHLAGDVWERPGALPRLFLPAAAESLSGRGEGEPPTAVGDFAALAGLGDLPGGRQSWRAREPAAAELEILRLESTRVAAGTRAPEARLLASSIYQDGGWRLLVDGRRRATTCANGPFVAAWLPAGEHTLELLYRPAPFVVGCLLAALALAAGAAWLVPPPRPGRMTPCPTSSSSAAPTVAPS